MDDFKIEWSSIEKEKFRIQRLARWADVVRMRDVDSSVVESPYVAATSGQEASVFAFDVFSPSVALERESAILSAAIIEYRNVVQRYFEHLIDDLELSSIWPFRLVGRVHGNLGGSENPKKKGWWVLYYLEPVESEKDFEVNLELATDAQVKEFLDSLDGTALRNKFVRMRPKGQCGFTMCNTQCHLLNSHPVSSLVFEWITRELKKIGLLDSAGGGQFVTTSWINLE